MITSGASDDFKRLIRGLLEENDAERSKEISKAILQDLGLGNENNIIPLLNDIALERLSLLAFAGSKRTQQVFSDAIKNSICIPQDSGKSRKMDLKNICNSNRMLLFSADIGRKLIRQLIIWNWERRSTRDDEISTDALDQFSDVTELLGKS